MDAIISWLGDNLANLQEYWNYLSLSWLWVWALGLAFGIAFACTYFAKFLSHWARAAGFILLLGLSAPGLVWLLGQGQEHQVTVWLDNAPKAGLALTLPGGKVLSDGQGRIFLTDRPTLNRDTVRVDSDLLGVADAGWRGKQGFVALAWDNAEPILEGAQDKLLQRPAGPIELNFTFTNKNGDKTALNRQALELVCDAKIIPLQSPEPAMGSFARFRLDELSPGRHELTLFYPGPQGRKQATYQMEILPPPPPPAQKKPPLPPTTIRRDTPMGADLGPVSTQCKLKKNGFAVGQLLEAAPPQTPLTLSFTVYREGPGASLIIFFGNYRFDVGGSDGRSISRFVHDKNGQPLKDAGVNSKPITFQLLEDRVITVTLRYTPQQGEGYPSLTIDLEQQGRQNNPPFESRQGSYTFDFPREAFSAQASPRILLGAASIPAKETPAISALRIMDVKLEQEVLSD